MAGKGAASSAAGAAGTSTPEDDARELTELCTKFLQCCESDTDSSPASLSSSGSPAAAALAALRRSILLKPMPEQPKTPTSCNLRGHVWQLLLGSQSMSASSYESLVACGPCHPRELYSKIRGDCFRTFTDDEAFWATVTEAQLSRVLNAFVHLQGKTRFRLQQGGDKASPFTYLQGMNALAGAFLSCMSEADAFASFRSFVVEHTPLYWLSSHIGANAGCKLVDAVLAVVDPALSAHLSDHSLCAYVYAFHAVSGFCSTIRPLAQVLRLWDALLAVGPHFNVLCVAAQVVLLREKLLASENPKSILDYRVWPKLDAGRTMGLAMAFIPRLSKELLKQIAAHATDARVAESISGTSMHENTKGLILGWHEPDSNASR